MPASSTCAAFVVALKAALTARFAAHGTLSAVKVDLVPTGDMSVIDRVVMVRERISGGQSYATFANRRDDSYTIPGLIVTASADPDTDVAFQTCWDKAALILDEVILQLRDTPVLAGDALKKAQVMDISYLPAPRDQGGWVTQCEYTVEYGSIVS